MIGVGDVWLGGGLTVMYSGTSALLLTTARPGVIAKFSPCKALTWSHSFTATNKAGARLAREIPALTT